MSDRQQQQQQGQPHPSFYLGLSTLFWTPVLLFTKDVHSLRRGNNLLKEDEGFVDVFYLEGSGHPVQRVQLTATIVSLHPSSRSLTFNLEDGTSPSLPCVLWLPEDNLCQVPSLKLGDVVTVVGRVGVWMDMVQVTVSFYRVEQDPNHELLHWAQVLNLKKKIYNHPFQAKLPEGGGGAGWKKIWDGNQMEFGLERKSLETERSNYLQSLHTYLRSTIDDLSTRRRSIQGGEEGSFTFGEVRSSERLREEVTQLLQEREGRRREGGRTGHEVDWTLAKGFRFLVEGEGYIFCCGIGKEGEGGEEIYMKVSVERLGPYLEEIIRDEGGRGVPFDIIVTSLPLKVGLPFNEGGFQLPKGVIFGVIGELVGKGRLAEVEKNVYRLV